MLPAVSPTSEPADDPPQPHTGQTDSVPADPGTDSVRALNADGASGDDIDGDYEPL
jgi:hypothetical protein